MGTHYETEMKKKEGNKIIEKRKENDLMIDSREMHPGKMSRTDSKLD